MKGLTPSAFLSHRWEIVTTKSDLPILFSYDDGVTMSETGIILFLDTERVNNGIVLESSESFVYKKITTGFFYNCSLFTYFIGSDFGLRIILGLTQTRVIY